MDDIGVADFGFSGGRDIPTPNIDQLARGGFICTSAYVQPMCSPTRAMLLTGRYPQRLGYEDNRPFDTPHLGLDKSVPTLPKKLREAGYATVLVGKWHLGKGEHFEFAPRNRGFDEFFGYTGAMGHYVNPTYSRNGAEKVHEGYGTDILTTEAIARITAWKNKPFFLHLAYTAAHLKQEAKAEDLAKFAHFDKKRQMAAAIISNLEGNIGRLKQSLKDAGANRHELYNLATDVSEAHDLAAQEPARLQTMRVSLDEWRASLKPQLIPPAPKAKGKKPEARATMNIPAGGPVPALDIKAQEQHPDPTKDRFGGDKRTQLKATGNFRVEQVKGRWFFITPEGHPFIALGPNHTGPTIRDQGRNNGLWARWGNDPERTATEMLKIIQDMGFTAGDVYQPEATYTRTLPWITFFWYGAANHTFIDVFNEPAMADVTCRAFEHAKSVADNPWVLGIGGPDLSIWDDKLVRKYR